MWVYIENDESPKKINSITNVVLSDNEISLSLSGDVNYDSTNQVITKSQD